MLLLCHEEHKAAFRTPLSGGFFPFALPRLAAGPIRVASTPDLLQPGSHPPSPPPSCSVRVARDFCVVPTVVRGARVPSLSASSWQHETGISHHCPVSLAAPFSLTSRQQLSFASIRVLSPGDRAFPVTPGQMYTFRLALYLPLGAYVRTR